MEHGGLVQWREWSAEAFADAAAQDKPILLDIGAVWCHWCHVMDTGIEGDVVHTGVYSSPEIADLIHRRFIPIKVDTDRRPDINARYNMGGWPTTAFLTPQGEPLYGETYVPPQRMLGLLKHIADYYGSHRSEIAERLADQRAHESADTPAGEVDGLPSAEIVDTVAAAIKGAFDPVYGGFGTSPKFPQIPALSFALRRYAETGDAEMRHVFEKTVDAMAGGGMYDRYAGGFFRYSTTRDWSVPHYEKMLQDNALLSALCFRAADVLGESRFRDIGESVHGWLADTLLDPDTGAFAGSQDADREEAYYGLTLAERASQPTPFIDRTLYLDWNAFAASSLAERYASTGNASALTVAKRTYEFAKSRIWPSHFLAGGERGGPVRLLGDTIAMLDAALDLAGVAAESAPYLADAREFADGLVGTLQDGRSGGFFDIVPEADAVAAMARPKKEIAADSAAASALLRLAAYTGIASYRQAAQKSLRQYVGEFRKYSLYAAPYGEAVAQALISPVHIVLVGPPGPSADSLRRAAWRAAPWAALEQRSASSAGEFPAPGADGPEVRGYVCVGAECHVADSPEQIAAALASH